MERPSTKRQSRARARGGLGRFENRILCYESTVRTPTGYDVMENDIFIVSCPVSALLTFEASRGTGAVAIMPASLHGHRLLDEKPDPAMLYTAYPPVKTSMTLLILFGSPTWLFTRSLQAAARRRFIVHEQKCQSSSRLTVLHLSLLI